jgi:hypothetical protein
MIYSCDLAAKYLRILSFLKLLGNIKDIDFANWQHFFINLIANEDWRPNGGLPIICILLNDF